LGRIRDERARARALALLDQPSWGETLAARALEALGSLRDPSLAAILEAWTDDDRPDRARAAAASALARLADEVESCRLRAVEVLTHLAEHGPLRVAVAALGGLTALRDGRAVPALTRVHRGARDGRCRRLAWEALAAIAEGRTSDAGLQAVRARVDVLSDENRRLRERLERLEPAG
jgi:HEAT repeat protein